ncbi:type II toxin-antitoxin system RelE/ParE family toxin [Methylobacterium sp. SD21]|uniref:type II toxin-antitoxin system RelE/ParE family toxin n=1 Tax=Methylobacterium litchii TaxID=3138810 RepID=UPI00313C7645
MKLRFTPDALAEMDAVLGGVADKSPIGASNVRRRIEATLDRLIDHPLCGARTSSPPLRRILVRPYPYLIFYEPRDDAVIVIAVRHAARDPFSMPGDQPDPDPKS